MPFRLTGLIAAVAVLAAADAPSPKPLKHAHAHNDYLHDRPLLDALDRGFRSVEADIFLKDGRLLVGHSEDELRPERTLEALYLDPLRERIRRHRDSFSPASPFYLLIDIKSDAAATYAALDKRLADYADIFSSVRDGKAELGPVTAVVSGNRDETTIRAQRTRYAGIDGRPTALDLDEPAHVMPWISANWAAIFRWRGDGPMPEDERRKLRDYVRKAHDRGRLVRFWATPENEAFWAELLGTGVDLIGTDDLDGLKSFLLRRDDELRRLQNENGTLIHGEPRISD